MSIIFPKVLSMEAFGYWQIFLFYSSFVGFFHFGFSDGVYLRYAGRNFDYLNFSLIKGQFLILCAIQFILSFCFLAYQYFFGQKDFREIVLFLVMFMIINNLTSFITGLFQAVNKLKVFSYTNIITSLSFLLFVSFLFLIKKTTLLNIYISYITSFLLGLLFVLYNSKEIFRSKINRIRINVIFSEYKINTLVGFYLMISSVSSMLILGVGRFAIEKKWGVITFGIVSLSFTITLFMLFFIRQIGVVILPLIKTARRELQRKYFVFSINILNIILLGSLLFFPLIYYIVISWLPKYHESVKYLIFIMPMLVYEGKMQIIFNTFMKAQRKENALMYINVFCLCVSVVLCGLGYNYNSIEFIVLSMTIATIVRGVILEYFLNSEMSMNNNMSILMVFLVVSAFVFLFRFFKIEVAWLLYFILYVLFLLGNRFNISKIIREIKLYL